jgi:hypothetical protein
LFASPYGFGLVHYYRTLLFNPLLSKYVNEWRPSTFFATLPFFLLVFGVMWLVSRRPSTLTLFDKGALVVTAAAGLMAIRGIVWFALATLVLVPKALDAEWPSAGTARPPRSVRTLAIFCSAAAVVAATFSLVELPRALARSYPEGAVAAVQNAARQNPSFSVFASERYADWLLWRDPSLAGRLAYDVRFELFSQRQFEQLALFHDGLGLGALHNARLILLDRARDSRAARRLMAESGTRQLFSDAAVVVLLRRF